MKVAIYMRVSDPKKGQTTDNQIPEIHKFIKSREHEIYKTYIDEVSAIKKRPAWDEMMNDAFQGKFKAIVVWKLDRFARSLKDLVVNLELLHSWKVSFIAVTQNIDTSDNSPVSRMIVQMLGMMAEFERSLISERIKAGMTRKRDLGIPIGRRAVVFDRIKAHELYKEFGSWRAVAKAMGVKKTTMIERMRGISSPDPEGEAKRKPVTN